ncbi:MAG: hypothetical protein GY839_07760 [candidate division Zixibacteria bacterium]|nr:hypothetical protein [candidate division Zixibacteria bacterium]
MKRIVSYLSSYKLLMLLILLLIFEIIVIKYSHALKLFIFSERIENNQVTIESNNLKIPANSNILNVEYFEDTNNANLITFQTGKMTVLVSSIKSLKRMSINSFINDIFYTHITNTIEENVSYKIAVPGDTISCYRILHKKKKRGTNGIIEVLDKESPDVIGDYFILPEKKLYFQILGIGQTIDDSINIIRDIVYYDQPTFFWRKIVDDSN